MANVFAQSGAKAINLFRKHIFHTQLALSLFYVVIVGVILVVSSQITRSMFVHRITPRFDERGENSVFPRLTRPSAAEVQEDLRETMLMVNAILLSLAGVLGYFLAGATLAPLRASYEKEQRFLHDASHELRTPLTILRTTLENIKLKGSDGVKKDAEEAIEEIDRMHHLLQNILTLSRAEQYSVQKEPISCQELLESIAHRMQPIAEKKSCTLSLNLPEEKILVFGEKEALERALVNLVQNAITYNVPQGKVTLSLKKERSRAIICIQDTGIGMNSEELSHLTERFYRAEKSRTRSMGGSGLGLAIVAQIIKDHKGTITFMSEPEKGTVVTMTLPIHKAS